MNKHQQKIKAMLVERGIKQVDIARELGLKPVTAHNVLNGHGISWRLRECVAKRLGKPVESLWPDYPGHGKRKKRGVKK